MCMYLSSQVTLNSLIVLYVVNSYTCDMVVLLVPCTTSSSGCTWALDNKGAKQQCIMSGIYSSLKSGVGR